MEQPRVDRNRKLSGDRRSLPIRPPPIGDRSCGSCLPHARRLLGMLENFGKAGWSPAVKGLAQSPTRSLDDRRNHNLKSKAWGRKLEVASKMVCYKERKARRIPDQVLQLLLEAGSDIYFLSRAIEVKQNINIRSSEGKIVLCFSLIRPTIFVSFNHIE